MPKQVKKGATDVATFVFIGDATDGSPETAITVTTLDIQYTRNGSAATAKVDATAGSLTTHTDNTIIEVDATDQPGLYRVCWPDAMFASGTDGVVGTVVGTGFHPAHTEFELVDHDPQADIAAILVDTGTTLDTKLNDIQGATFSSATDSLEALRDRGDSAWTGSPPTSDSGTAQAGSTTTITLEAGFPATDDILVGQVIYLTGGPGAPASAAISAYNGTTGVATIIGTWPGGVTPTSSTTYDIYPDDIDEITDPPTAAAIADAVWDENTAGHTAGGTFGEQVKNDIDAILVDTSTTLDTAISNMQGNVTDILADTNELQGDWVDTGRLDTILDSILTDTANIDTQVGTAGAGLTAIPWNAAWDAQVESECNDALVALNLDHLLAVAVGSADVIDNSVIAKLVSSAATADWDTYVSTTDSMQAIRDKQTDIETDTADIQSRLPTALIGGRMNSDVEAINNVVIVGDGSATPFDV